MFRLALIVGVAPLLLTTACGSARQAGAAHGASQGARPIGVAREPRTECAFGASRPEAIAVRFTELLASPAAYAGKRVRVRAFLVNELEDHGVYESEEDADRPVVRVERRPWCDDEAPVAWPMIRSIWWDLPVETFECNRAFAAIEGLFDPCEAGHMGLFAGGLKDISFVGAE